MRTVKLLMFAALLLSVTTYAEVLSESSKDVGFGFREVLRSQTNPPGHWEGVGHFAFFYYKDKELSQFDSYSISPSGQYALFQDGPSGKVMLFKPSTGQVIEVTSKFIALVSGFKWDEPKKSATVLFDGGQQPIKVTLE